MTTEETAILLSCFVKRIKSYHLIFIVYGFIADLIPKCGIDCVSL